MSGYVGRFAPSPTGPLHAGSAAAALAGYLDARAHGGRWILRIEDVDSPRNVAGAADLIQEQLRFLGLEWDGPVVFQSARFHRYEEAFQQLAVAGHLFGCACSRREIADSLTLRAGPTPANRTPIYPGTCRNGISRNRLPRAWRFRVGETSVTFQDRWLGPQRQHPASEIGDFVVKRADGLWAYQLAVVVDDADACVTHVVRGRDILESTGRQILLQRALHYATPGYLHLPLAVGADGEKLSKQNGARSITKVDTAGSPPAACDLLDQAARLLQMQPPATRDRAGWLAEATRQWALRFGT
ncbi:MAG TPA: tRNA glutamyl-Q(34) synthetase GluQRS [Lautropia sp.]|jgi:glutamyl-Q tRNA(Asp) synthetase|nr:tRNA glutamyl-Q(34) synthetase GluQRS [Lautropia sp.]